MVLLFSLDEAARADPAVAEYMRTVLGAILDGKHLPPPLLPASEASEQPGPGVKVHEPVDGDVPGAPQSFSD